MALFPVRCPGCGLQGDQVLTPPRHGGAPDFDPCGRCGGAVERVYTVPGIKCDATFKPFWTDSLGDGPGPVYVKTREHWKELMAPKGLRPLEKGEIKDQMRRAKEYRERDSQRASDDIGRRFDVAFEKAVDHVRQAGEVRSVDSGGGGAARGNDDAGA